MTLPVLKREMSFFYKKIKSILLRPIPKKKNLVLFSAWFGEKYIDNTRYLYEYLIEDQNLIVYWLTKSQSIYDDLKTKNYPVAKFSSLKGFYLQLRARVCFSTVQFYDFDCWLLSRCIYIDLGHGNMIKDPGSILHDRIERRKQSFWLKNMHYYAIVPSTYAKQYYKQIVETDDNSIIVSDFARNDVFIDPSLRIGKNTILDTYSNKRRIVYMPTHRSDGKVDLHLDRVLPLREINQLCEQTGSVFIIKRHFYHRTERIDLSSYANIVDITSNEEIDPQVLLYQADILITDYSSCFIDYLLLSRPILFYQFDYDSYISNERSLFIDFEKEKFAPVVKKKELFTLTLKRIIEEGNKSYLENCKRITRLFFDNPIQTGGRNKDKEILLNLMNKR